MWFFNMYLASFEDGLVISPMPVLIILLTFIFSP